MEVLYLFGATLFQVFAISMQNIEIIKNRIPLAMFWAMCVAIGNVVIYRTVPDAGLFTIISYVGGNAIGVGLAIRFGRRGVSADHAERDASTRGQIAPWPWGSTQGHGARRECSPKAHETRDDVPTDRERKDDGTTR
jgi:hypothetical protein